MENIVQDLEMIEAALDKTEARSDNLTGELQALLASMTAALRNGDGAGADDGGDVGDVGDGGQASAARR